MNIARKIDDMRVKKGWTFYKLAQETGLAQPTITKWIEGKATPSIPALQALCDAYGISLANFFAEKGMVEATPEIQTLVDNWHALTIDEREVVDRLMKKFLKRYD